MTQERKHTPGHLRFDPIKDYKLRSYDPEFCEDGSPSLAFITPGPFWDSTMKGWEEFKDLIAQAPALLAERDRLREENEELLRYCRVAITTLTEGTTARYAMKEELEAALTFIKGTKKEAK